MTDFYEQLAADKNKSVALREAQLNYLETAADTAKASPFYWAATIPVGNMEPIAPPSIWPKFALVMTMCLFALVLVFRKSNLALF